MEDESKYMHYAAAALSNALRAKCYDEQVSGYGSLKAGFVGFENAGRMPLTNQQADRWEHCSKTFLSDPPSMLLHDPDSPL